MKRGHRRVSPVRSKKAVLGIETLIIFIAMILVAAVAAGVLIRTSGTLQQRALTVSSETITRVATGIELIQVTANANTTGSYIQEMEFLLRLSAGSDTLKMRDLGFSYISEELFLAAEIAHTDSLSQVTKNLSYIDNATAVNLYNMDNDKTDNEVDTITFFENISGSGYHGFQFDLSTAGLVNQSLGYNLSNQSDLDINNLPIEGTNEQIYGYIHLNGSFDTVTDSLNDTSDGHNFTLEITHYPTRCKFETLRPDVNYCVEPRIGDKDINFETGEMLILRYRLSPEHKLINDKAVEVSLIPSKALISTISFNTPEAFPTYKVILWP